ncbi:MET8 [Candida pseudojiufengensis]|uniref:MET8 n=1 Tax=Candida pseudojiufengensis TaxID=497109 RepID=UPI00222520E5|nr:MET8 [Candida pseudojiufengensis]KAI5961605.1 MET8 [Candida pseudojiufengensis]
MKGSLLLAWQVKDKHCLVIGSGDVALSRINHLLIAQAKITVITGDGHIHAEISDLAKSGEITLINRNYQDEDLKMYEKLQVDLDYKNINIDDYSKISQLVNETFACVLCCIDDYELSTKIYYQCKLLRLPVNIADKPPLCDFYFGSMINQDNLQIMISTNGKSPRLSKLIKDNIAKQFVGVDLNNSIENLGLIRARLRELILIDDDLVTIDTRMNWIKTLTDFFTVKEWSLLHLTQDQADKIIKSFPNFPPKQYDEFQTYISS